MNFVPRSSRSSCWPRPSCSTILWASDVLKYERCKGLEYSVVPGSMKNSTPFALRMYDPASDWLWFHFSPVLTASTVASSA